MPDKTERILGNLSRLFLAGPRQTSPLYRVVDSFGSQLQQAENNLAAVMRTHWVDHADKGDSQIDDLARIAALYGLAPREDETIEEFREHLLRYVHTFLDGTVTVQGSLRVVAEALGLHIEDSYDDLDLWWKRPDPDLVTVEPVGKDATELVFGYRSREVRGVPPRAASVKSQRSHLAGIDLSTAYKLSVIVDDNNPVEIDLSSELAPAFPGLTAVPLTNVVTAINTLFGSPLAREEASYLILASPTIGASSRLELLDIDHDAALVLLGVSPRSYGQSGENRAAQVTSLDLSGGVVLGDRRFLRIVVDKNHLAEIDLNGATSAEDVRDRINNAFATLLSGHLLASVESGRVTLTSPTASDQSVIAFQRPASQDATNLLFGAVQPLYLGASALPARIVGTSDHHTGTLDLSDNAILQLRFDEGASYTIDCAGEDAAHTLTSEVVNAINNAVGATVARFDGTNFRLTSTQSGAASRIVLETPPLDDAANIIFGIGPRVFVGKSARASRIQGKVLVRVELDENEDETTTEKLPDLNLSARYRIAVAVDGGDPVEIDLRSLVAVATANNIDITKMEPGPLADAINATLGKRIAASDGERLTLLSETVGGASRLALRPLEQKRRRRYVSRAAITDEATPLVFGFNRREAHGNSDSGAQIVGKADLSRGVDLRTARFLRVQIDDLQPIDIDCAGKRARATELRDVVEKLNDGLHTELGFAHPLVSHDGKRLTIKSPQRGARSRVVLSGSSGMDALSVVLGLDPQTAHGSNAEQVSFISTVDLSGGIDLPADAAIQLAVDGATAVDIPLTEAAPAHLTIEDIALKINLALQLNVARRAQNTISITSPKRGADSQLAFGLPAQGNDSTQELFGFVAPRVYQGTAASAAKLRGNVEIAAPIDLSVTRYLRLAVNGGSSVDVDCAAGVADATSVTLDQIVSAVNNGLKPKIASLLSNKLVLTSPTTGSASQILIEPPADTKTIDAAVLLLGKDYAPLAHGDGNQSAKLASTVDLRGPQDLSKTRFLWLSIDGEAVTKIDCAAVSQDSRNVTPDEIVAAINAAVRPRPVATNVANHLVLTSPVVGANTEIKVERYVADDTCRRLLFGDAPASSQGQSARAAAITGEVSLLQPVNLSRRQVIRLQVDDRPPFDVRLGRLAPSQVLLTDIVEDINKVFPNLASVADDRLQLTSPSSGPSSYLAVLPLRYLEVIEYPQTSYTFPADDAPPLSVSHGGRWRLNNGGVGGTTVEAWLTAPQGTTGPGLINTFAGWRIRALCSLNAGDTLHLWRTEAAQLRGEIIPLDGSPVRPLTASQLISGPIGVQVRVPFRNEQPLVKVEEGYSALQLNNILSDNITLLRAREPLAGQISVKVVEQTTPVPPPDVLPIDGETVELQGRVSATTTNGQTTYYLLDADDQPLAILWAGQGIQLDEYRDRAVAVRGARFFDDKSILVAERIWALFDVTLTYQPDDGDPELETYFGVTIGDGMGGGSDPLSLAYVLCTRSTLVVAEELPKVNALALSNGSSEWMYTDCYGTRFNIAFFEDDARRYYFAGGIWNELGIFNVSHFWYAPSGEPPAPASALMPAAHYAPWADQPSDPLVNLRFAWITHQPGAFEVNLPDDLPPRFGQRFNEARFGHDLAKLETYSGVVLEPPDDDDHLRKRWESNRNKSIVEIEVVEGVPPIGWTAVQMPFRTQQRLRIESEKGRGRLYLADPNLPDHVVIITTKEAGDWATDILVAARQGGPARFDLTIYYPGARFENARQVALGGKDGEDLASLTQKLIQPGPVGLLQGKAAGVRLRITRDRTTNS